MGLSREHVWVRTLGWQPMMVVADFGPTLEIRSFRLDSNLCSWPDARLARTLWGSGW